MKKSVIAIVVLVATVVSAEPTIDKRELKRQHVRELLVLLNEERTVRFTVHDTLAKMIGSMKDGFEASSPDLDERDAAAERQAYEKEVDEFSARFEEIFFQKLDYKKFEEEYVLPLYEKYFSDDEIVALKAFYSSPVGTKSLEVLPNLMSDVKTLAAEKLAPLAIEAGKQLDEENGKKNPWKPTMASIRSIATALEAYSIDEESLPADGSYETLRTALAPTYIKELPKKDGWGNDFVVVISPDRQHYRIVSAGADGTLEWDSRKITELTEDSEAKLVEHLEDDIIYQDGSFVQQPRISRRSHL